MAERLDLYDDIPDGMRKYLSFNGFHFSKPMYRWAVSMMKDRNGNKVEFMEKEQVTDMLTRSNVTGLPEMGYDVPFVYLRKRSDSLGGSIIDEPHLAMAVKEFFTDNDGYETMAFDEFLSKMNAKGISIPWEDLL